MSTHLAVIGLAATSVAASKQSCSDLSLAALGMSPGDSARDATHVLDEILDNQTDLPIAEHTTDTDLVFGLFDLLGLRFSPRIADLGHQRLYHLGPLTHAPTVAGVLKHRINTEIIAQH